MAAGAEKEGIPLASSFTQGERKRSAIKLRQQPVGQIHSLVVALSLSFRYSTVFVCRSGTPPPQTEAGTNQREGEGDQLLS